MASRPRSRKAGSSSSSEPPSQQQRSEQQTAVQHEKGKCCPYPGCNAHFKGSPTLLLHMNTHHPLPGDSLPPGATLVDPRDASVAIGSQVVNCDLCGWWCKTTGLTRHQQKNNGPCDKRLASWRSTHRRQVPMISAQPCPLASTLPADPVDLANHNASHQLDVHNTVPFAHLHLSVPHDRTVPQ
jgi:hypothetical protein